ncbi:hypothetical protein BDN72DRAFT_858096 [Pluteus cervinus]|uniref:Uncharacterized protein n=1 Tax=Pluteus cervinus TaxID=181527 RepID=A0ACD3AT21_9AGAR|nr:hypothetical protein BDN72DRAFT_858096 [Pluteus cervinus]
MRAHPHPELLNYSNHFDGFTPSPSRMHIPPIHDCEAMLNNIFREWGGYEVFMRSYGLKLYENDTEKGLVIIVYKVKKHTGSESYDGDDSDDGGKTDPHDESDAVDEDFGTSEDEVDAVDAGVDTLSDDEVDGVDVGLDALRDGDIGSVGGGLDDEVEAEPGPFDDID